MPEYIIAISGNNPPAGGFAGDDSLVTINIDNPLAPVLGGVVTDAVHLANAARAVIRGNYAYVCSQGGFLTIVDISNPLAPIVVGFVAITGAWDVALSGDYAYVTGTFDRNFHSVNIADPTAPFIEDTIATATDPSGVKIQGDYAYVCGADGFWIFNITDPTTLVQESYTPDPGAGELAACSALEVDGVYAYVCAFNIFTILDVTNVAAPAVTDTFANGVDLPAPQLNGLYGIDKVGDTIYLCVGGGFYFVVLDVANPAVIASLGVLDITAIIPALTPRPVEVIVDGIYAYVNMGSTGNNTTHGLRILDISNPAAITLQGSFVGGGAPNFLDDALGMGALFYVAPTVQTDVATGVT